MEDRRRVGPKIAYFSMEIGLESGMQTYSGGLGMLAGDTIRSAADMGVPLAAVTLLHRKGYLRQSIRDGWQREEAAPWPISDFVRELPQRVALTVEGRKVMIRAWRRDVRGVGGFIVPVYFLDADLPENLPWDRTLTDFLYGGDARYRLCQEAVLGIGGVRMLRALGCTVLDRFHMNEGHSSLLALELLDEQMRRAGRRSASHEDVEAVRKLCVFTTHTPVAAGHDQFPMDLVDRVLGRREIDEMNEIFCCEGRLNLTYLALNLSHYVNGVAKRHGEIARLMYGRYPIESITNGIHAATWASPPISALLDRHIPDWRHDNFSLRHALKIPRQELWTAHKAAKEALIQRVNSESGAGMEATSFTIGFARRATAYKRGDLILRDAGRLVRVAEKTGGLQLVFAGKAHPQDQGGKEIIRRIIAAGKSMRSGVKIAYLADYDMDLGRTMTAGADLWLNTPQAPLEASGTSGMKAAVNAVPSLSILDGWWVEGHIEGITGWAIGEDDASQERHDQDRDAASLYGRLEESVIPMYYRDRSRYIDVMRHALALNGSFFNTQRMVQQYVVRAYL